MTKANMSNYLRQVSSAWELEVQVRENMISQLERARQEGLIESYTEIHDEFLVTMKTSSHSESSECDSK